MMRLRAMAQGNTLAIVGIAFVAGALMGLLVLGWWLWPVQWTNAGPADLQDAWRTTYLSMVADSYSMTGDATAAKQRLDALVTSNRTTAQISVELQAMAQKQADANDAEGAGRLQALAATLGAPEAGANPQPGTAPLPSPPRAPAPLFTRFLRIVGLVILVLVVLAGLLLLVYFLQSRTTADAAVGQRVSAATTRVETRAAPPVQPVAPPVVTPRATPPAPAAEAAMIGPFVATYNLGDIDFDMSFGIESPNGDFLGECGLGMAETIGGGDVQRVTAFEVWLFDKADIRTVSLVLASSHAHADAALRTKLASRGEVVLAQPGGSFTVKTSSLRLDGRVLDLAYGGGDVPAQSYFTSFSVELTPVLLATEQSE